MVPMACGSTQQELPPMPDLTVLTQSATLGPGDVIEIRVYKEKDLSGLYRVGRAGLFDFPLIGQVTGNGKHHQTSCTTSRIVFVTATYVVHR